MKNKTMKKLIVFFILAVALAAVFSGCAKSENIALNNPDFESGMTSTGGFSGWQRYDYYGKMVEGNPYTEFSEAEGVSGKAVCIENRQSNDARVYQHIDAPTGSNYKITAMVKAENVPDEGAGANISVMSYGGTSRRITGTTDWTEVTVYVEVTTGKEGFDVALCMGGYSAESTGKAYFDNVKVEKVNVIPEDAKVITIFEKSNNSSSEEEKDSGVPVWLEYTFKLLFFACIIGLAVYAVKLSKKADKAHLSENRTMSEERGKPDKKDWIIIGIMTLLIGVISFIRLGDTKAASHYWKAQNNGEYVTVTLDKETHIDRYTYSGNIPTSGKYLIEYEDAATGSFVEVGTIEKSTFFEWKTENVDFTTSKIRITATSAGLALNEVAFWTKDADSKWQLVPVTVAEQQGEERGSSGRPEFLFDEQDAAVSVRTYMNGTYFDEIYFPRTAYENIEWLPVYETTHPPLGKLLISLGIRIFGMNPFGWRFMGTLLGVLLVPVMYLFGLKIFKKRLYGFTAAFLMMFDFMRFSQTRLATIDTYSVLFVILMYYYMYDYFTTKSYDLQFKQSLKPLLFCGLFFGVGVASKWTSLYAGAGLAFLFFLAKYLEYKDVEAKRAGKSYTTGKWFKSNFVPTCLFCVVVFIAIPALIYVLSYIPYKAGDPDKGLIQIVLDNQKYMYNYHSKLNATHAYSSYWWQWPVIGRPIWFFHQSEIAEGYRSTIASFGNPAIWWTGIAAIFASLVLAWRKNDKKMIVVFVAFALQYCPWMLVTRCTFIYHFFTSVPFVILMIVYCVKYIIDTPKLKTYSASAMMAIVSGIVFLFGVLVKLGMITGNRDFTSAVASLMYPAVMLLAFSLVTYVTEKYGDKKKVRYYTLGGLTVTTVLLAIFMPSAAFVTGALLIGNLVDLVLRAKRVEFHAMSLYISYLALVAGLFAAFWPALSGMTVTTKYIESLRWLPSWYF